MALTFKEFLATPQPGPEPCGCGTGCGLFLEPRVDGARPKVNGKEVNPDCVPDGPEHAGRVTGHIRGQSF